MDKGGPLPLYRYSHARSFDLAPNRNHFRIWVYSIASDEFYLQRNETNKIIETFAVFLRFKNNRESIYIFCYGSRNCVPTKTFNQFFLMLLVRCQWNLFTASKAFNFLICGVPKQKMYKFQLGFMQRKWYFEEPLEIHNFIRTPNPFCYFEFLD